MARKPTPAPKSKETAIVPGALEADTAAANTLALARIDHGRRVTELAVQLNYQGSTDPAALENSARDAIKRIGMSIFELGAYLLLLKEACVHGQFLPTLERLGIGVEASRRYMQISKRFSNSSTSRNLEAVGMSKLVELLPLDDEQLDDLTELGQTGELALDKVATMSVKELRAAVREAKAEKEADATLLKTKNNRIDRLEREVARIERLTPDKDLLDLKQKATAVAADAEGAILGGLRQALIALSNHGEERGLHQVFMAGLVGQVQAQLTALRAEFSLPDASTLADQELAAEVAQWGSKA